MTYLHGQRNSQPYPTLVLNPLPRGIFSGAGYKQTTLLKSPRSGRDDFKNRGAVGCKGKVSHVVLDSAAQYYYVGRRLVPALRPRTPLTYPKLPRPATGGSSGVFHESEREGGIQAATPLPVYKGTNWASRASRATR